MGEEVKERETGTRSTEGKLEKRVAQNIEDYVRSREGRRHDRER